VFVQKHLITRGETVICEGREVRAFITRHPDNPDRIKAIRVPDDIRAKCE
jgi:4-hydroxybenzoyl-CoA thioesterase